MADKLFHCDDCNIDTSFVYIDGYPVGDRILEDVIFMVEDKNGKPKTIDVVEYAKEYFKGLNRKYWFKEINEYAAQLDYAMCPNCTDGEIAVWGVDIERKPATIINGTKFTDILKQ